MCAQGTAIEREVLIQAIVSSLIEDKILLAEERLFWLFWVAFDKINQGYKESGFSSAHTVNISSEEIAHKMQIKLWNSSLL